MHKKIVIYYIFKYLLLLSLQSTSYCVQLNSIILYSSISQLGCVRSFLENSKQIPVFSNAYLARLTATPSAVIRMSLVQHLHAKVSRNSISYQSQLKGGTCFFNYEAWDVILLNEGKENGQHFIATSSSDRRKDLILVFFYAYLNLFIGFGW